jgi:DNA-3-methyladenine glycosylase I
MKEKTRCKWADTSPEMQHYHDYEYGFKIKDDYSYFERLTLEIFQAGLSWSTIIKKRTAFRKAFDDFDFYKISRYRQARVDKLMQMPGIIRNKLKINATVYNAKTFVGIVAEHRSFDKFLRKQDVDDREKMLDVFRSYFKFIGPLILEEFMMSAGFWKINHSEDCFLYKPDL